MGNGFMIAYTVYEAFERNYIFGAKGSCCLVVAWPRTDVNTERLDQPLCGKLHRRRGCIHRDTIALLLIVPE